MEEERLTVSVPLSNGKTRNISVKAAVWNAMDDAAREEALKEARQVIVNQHAQKLVAAQDSVTPGGGEGFFAKARSTMDEFARNYTGGLDDYVGAAASYIPALNGGEKPLDGLPFFERRDALRAARDMQAERIPQWLDNTASLAGVLTMGAGPKAGMLRGPKDALTFGGVVGGAAGVGNSEATTVGGVVGDGAIGAGVGAGVGLAADLALDKVVGGTFRRTLGAPDSNIAFHAQERLGIPPSVGSIGNEMAASLENSFARSPTAPISAMLPVPGRSAMRTQNTQRRLLDEALQREVTDPMRPPGYAPNRTPDDVDQFAKDQAARTRERFSEETNRMETDYRRLVPEGTPVNITNSRALPGDLRAAHRGPNVWQAAQKDIDFLNSADMYTVDTVLAKQLTTKLRNAAKELGRAEGQLAKLDPGDPQAAKLGATVKKWEAAIDDINREIYENEGPAFQALRDMRSTIGANTERGGLMGAEAKLLYGRVSQEMAAAADRIRPGAGDEFLRMTAREREMIPAKKLLDKIESAGSNYAALKAAARSGDWRKIDVLLENAIPEEKLALQADLVDLLGRGPKTEFDAGTFEKNWFNMSDSAKAKLFDGNPEGLAVAETLAEVAKNFTERGKMDWHSNSPAGVGLMAFFGAAAASPSKLVSFLTLVTGSERALVSEAMAKAVAGERTALGDLMRKALVQYAATEGKSRLDERMGPQ